MPIYMNYSGITGDVTAAGHEKWIELNSFQWGVGRGISSPTGGSSDREASAPSVSEIVVTKDQDSSTIKFMDASLQGEGVDVTIDFVKTDKGQLSVFLKYVLNDTMVSGFSMSSGGDRPSESVSLNFVKIQATATPLGKDNAEGSPESLTYDLGQAKVV